MLLGALPAIIVGVLFFAIIAGASTGSYQLATWVTSFADSWALQWRELLRLTLAIAIVVALIYFLLITFVAVTLFVGGPCYERIWRATENASGTLPPHLPGRARDQVTKSLSDLARSILMALHTALLGFLLGLIPLVGAPAAAVFVTIRGVQALALEITSYAADARGWSFAQRRQRLKQHVLRTFGLAFPFQLVFIIPGGALVGMPAAVAAGTLLVCDLSTKPSDVLDTAQ